MFGKSVRTKSLPFWHGRPLENIVHRRRLHACGRRMFALQQNNIFCLVCPHLTWPVNMFLRGRVLGGISLRTRHRSMETLETVHGVGERQCMYRVVPFFLYTYTRLLQPPRTHAIAVCSHAGPSRFPAERCRGRQGSRA